LTAVKLQPRGLTPRSNALVGADLVQRLHVRDEDVDALRLQSLRFFVDAHVTAAVAKERRRRHDENAGDT